MPTSRRPGLQGKWNHVFTSLEGLIPIYESGSSRIALFADGAMRSEVVRWAVGDDASGMFVLDLGSGPGTLSRKVAAAGGAPVLTDASRKMLLSAAPFANRVQCVFEHLPFRDRSFGSAVAGFSLRDSRDLISALGEVRRVLITSGGRFSFCDLGRPGSRLNATLIGFYIFAVVPIIGLLSGGPKGLMFASLYDTYLLTLDNPTLTRLLGRYFRTVSLRSRQMGGAIVVRCEV